MTVIVEPDPHWALTQPLSNPASSPSSQRRSPKVTTPASGGERRLAGRYGSVSVRVLVSGWRGWPPKLGPWSESNHATPPGGLDTDSRMGPFRRGDSGTLSAECQPPFQTSRGSVTNTGKALQVQGFPRSAGRPPQIDLTAIHSGSWRVADRAADRLAASIDILVKGWDCRINP